VRVLGAAALLGAVLRWRPNPWGLAFLPLLALSLVPLPGWLGATNGPYVASLLLRSIPAIAGAVLVAGAAGSIRWRPRWDARWLPPALAALAFASAALVQCAVYHGLPRIADARAQLFHAGMLAEGRCAAPPPARPEFFPMENVLTAPGWASQYPPLTVALLALGRLVGATGLVNPLLHALLVWVLARRAAVPAALLALASPVLFACATDHLSHPSAALALLLFFLALERGRAPAAALWLAAAFLSRPWTAALFAAGALVGRDRRLALSVAAGAALAGGGAFALWNHATTGSALLPGYLALHGGRHLPGFGVRGFADSGLFFTPGIALAQGANTLMLAGLTALGGPLPLLLLLAPSLLRPAPEERRLLLPLLALALGYAFWFWTDDFAFARFLAEATPLLALLGARQRGFRARLLAVGCLWSALLFLPREVADRATAAAPDVARFRAAGAAPPPALVFAPPGPPFDALAWANRWDLAGPRLFATDRGPANFALLADQPGRAPFLLDDDGRGPPGLRPLRAQDHHPLLEEGRFRLRPGEARSIPIPAVGGGELFWTLEGEYCLVQVRQAGAEVGGGALVGGERSKLIRMRLSVGSNELEFTLSVGREAWIVAPVLRVRPGPPSR
jgi:hypothetical protein